MADEVHVEDRSDAEADAEKIKRKSIKKPSGWNSFYQSVASEVTEQLRVKANIVQVSKLASNMWRTLPSERKMVDISSSLSVDPEESISSDPKLKTAVTRFECIVQDVERAGVLLMRSLRN
ncbi:uncharacterized protein [Acropora muricata]|uniref:uncharacterized protein n=1 Tax=Acropora muricata TaxID=159855 RepID=UPI0034E5E389